MLNTYVVTPPSGNDPFEVKAACFMITDGGKVINFFDGDNDTVASYVAFPGTRVMKK
jgi:hypothetical protein